MNERLLTVSEAEAAIASHLVRADPSLDELERCQAAVLAEPVLAERDQPPFDRVTMDGIAIAYASFAGGARRFPVQGTQAAGAAPASLNSSLDCVEVMTGAVLPSGSDTVIPVERLRVQDGMAVLEKGYAPEAGQFIHRRGSDYRRGSTLLTPGTRIGVPEIAILAANGKARVLVASSPRIAIISTGDEIVEIDQAVMPHQIRQSNSYAVQAALSGAGFTLTTRLHLMDDPESLRLKLKETLERHQVLILSGGVSRGKFDFVPGILEELGVQKHMHRVAQRPGKPMWFGTRSARQMVFALPGNPVSTLVCLHRYVLPALSASQGCRQDPRPRISLAEAVNSSPGMTSFVPVKLATDKHGRRQASPRQTNTSGDFSSLAGTHGFVELPAGQDQYPAGYLADFYPWAA